MTSLVSSPPAPRDGDGFTHRGHGRRAVAIGYAGLLALLLWTRAYGLDRSLWLDEIFTVSDFVRAGPGEILAGHYTTNSHKLFTFLAWVTTAALGESEVALRLWSVVPYVAGAIIVTVWLHVRLAPLAGMLFLSLATLTPLLLDITRQARGYGLAFFAMGALVVSALEARRGRSWVAWLVCAAGATGTLVLPQFLVAFLATSAALVVLDRELRWRIGVGTLLALAVIAAFYGPHVASIRVRARDDYEAGAQIEPLGLLASPFDQILTPALLAFDGVVLAFSVVWIPVAAALALIMWSSPLLRELRPALVLTAGVVATLLVVFASRVHVVPRFLSYLLVPLFMLLASGSASILASVRTRPLVLRTALVLGLLASTAVAFMTSWIDVVRLPREANKDAAAAIRTRVATSTPVYATMPHPRTLAFYLGRPVHWYRAGDDARLLCDAGEVVVLVVQPWFVSPGAVPCLRRSGVRLERFDQYARGGRIDVWFIPPGT